VIELDLSGVLPLTPELEAIERLVAALNASPDLEGLPSGRISLLFCDDETIREYNNQYAGHDYSTDVLSFSYIESGQAIDGTLGDMLISTETAARQAQKAGTDEATELALLALHGILHILGYDHAEATELDAMDSLQRRLLEQIGLEYRDFGWNS
jgi:probable rRNA maturation factor